MAFAVAITFNVLLWNFLSRYIIFGTAIPPKLFQLAGFSCKELGYFRKAASIKYHAVCCTRGSEHVLSPVVLIEHMAEALVEIIGHLPRLGGAGCFDFHKVQVFFHARLVLPSM